MGNDLTKVLLLILDGFGIAPNWGGNAITIAKMPNWEYIYKNYPHSILTAHGQAVGLPGNEMGNSEVGHLTIGAGRVVRQDSLRINKTISDRSFFKNEVLINAIKYSIDNDKPLHIMGLLSNGSVHATYNHLIALLKLCAIQKVKNVLLHLFSDGRDTPAYEGVNLIHDLINSINEISNKDRFQNKVNIQIATICGRYFAMDRNHHLDRIEKAIDCMVEGAGDVSNSVLKVFSNAYSKGKTDETISPTVIVDDNKQPIGLIKNEDPIIFFNFRKDRARQISEQLIYKLPNIHLVTFIPYGSKFNVEETHSIESAFKPEPIKSGLVENLSKNNINQFHIAEMEKYAHVTYFLNSGTEQKFMGEDRVLIPSQKVPTYDLYPQMSVEKISIATQKYLKNNKYRFGAVNIANPDMVGHSGILKAAIAALEATDIEIGKIVKAANRYNWFVIITSDHGNVEQMVDPVDGAIDPEHTINPVPFVIIPPEGNIKYDLKKFGTLTDIAPTILKILMLPIPSVMTGKCLI